MSKGVIPHERYFRYPARVYMFVLEYLFITRNKKFTLERFQEMRKQISWSTNISMPPISTVKSWYYNFHRTGNIFGIECE